MTNFAHARQEIGRFCAEVSRGYLFARRNIGLPQGYQETSACRVSVLGTPCLKLENIPCHFSARVRSSFWLDNINRSFFGPLRASSGIDTKIDQKKCFVLGALQLDLPFWHPPSVPEIRGTDIPTRNSSTKNGGEYFSLKLHAKPNFQTKRGQKYKTCSACPSEDSYGKKPGLCFTM